MKLFIFGIDMMLDDECPIQECRNIFTHHVPHALEKAPPGSIVLLVWYEYAFTETTITHDTKKKCMRILQEGLAAYDNVILIPGSFSVKQSWQSKPEKLQKIKQVYESKSENLVNLSDPLFMEEFSNFRSQEKKIAQGDTNGDYLSNKAYVLSKYSKFSQPKVNPCAEYSLLIDFDERYQFHLKAKDHSRDSSDSEEIESISINKPAQNWIFHGGMEKKTQKLAMGNHVSESIDIRMLICRDHNFDNVVQPTEVLPLLEVIVSNQTELDCHNLWGAVNIHMDSRGLSVHVNELHPRRACIEEISAVIVKSDLFLMEPIEIQHIERDLSANTTFKGVSPPSSS